MVVFPEVVAAGYACAVAEASYHDACPGKEIDAWTPFQRWQFLSEPASAPLSDGCSEWR
jgi:hypothetical protein